MSTLGIILVIVIITVIDHPARFGSWLHFVKRGYDAGSNRALVKVEDEKYRDCTKGLGFMTWLIIGAVAVIAVGAAVYYI